MSVAVMRPASHAAQDLLAIPEEERFHEIIDGELVRKAMPSAKHGSAQPFEAIELQVGVLFGDDEDEAEGA